MLILRLEVYDANLFIFKLKKSFIQSMFSLVCMSGEITSKFDWSVGEENVQTCAGYCSTNLRLKYLLRWIGYEN